MNKRIVYIGGIALSVIVGGVLLRGDLSSFLQWWLAILGIGLVFLPLTNLIFYKFNDRGYLFSKTIGIAITGYFMWLFSSLGILKFNTSACIFSFALGIALNISILIYQNKKKEASKKNKSILSLSMDVVDVFLKEELIFFVIFLILIYIRGFKPEAYGTEKFMDYGFMTSMMRSDYMPPQDFWFSGTNLNYYYLGQFLATYLTRLSFVPVSHGYNLMLMMIGAFAFVLPYSIVYNLMARFSIDKEKKSKPYIISELSGVLAGAAVCLASNMHYPIYKWILPTIKKIQNKAPGAGYWFPDATRFVGYSPDTNDKTIHEFPSYSFVLGDLHAHVINLLFVLTILGILFAWLYSREDKKGKDTPILKEVFQPTHILIGFFLGIFQATNFWDFPIYFIVSGAVILFSNMIVYEFRKKSLGITALQGILIPAIAFIVILPFTINFEAMSNRILATVAHTPFWQLMILWGLPLIISFAFLLFMIFDFINKNYKEKLKGKPKIGSLLSLFLDYLHPSSLYIIIIGLCAMGLVLIPELVYVEDIYSGDYKRANTMFKLTYQAFVMFGISFGYIFPRLIEYGRTKLQKIVAIIGLIIFLSTLGYFGTAVKSWYGNIFDGQAYKGLDAAAFMEEEMPEDYLATNWLNENVEGTPVVLEANGDSYTKYQRVSVITGLPTVLGWHTHEWLWKSDPGILDVRVKDVEDIYTSNDSNLVKELIDKYDISYIYVGELEVDKYGWVNHSLLQSLGEIVYSSSNLQDGEPVTYIIKVKG